MSHSLAQRSYRWHYVAIAVLGVVLFLPGLGFVHLFDWDEINFAECAREMLVTKNWLRVQIDFLPFWEKPPLFIWLQAASMWLFGVNEFAARLPNALIGVATLLALFHIGRRLGNPRLGWIWTLLYLCSWLPHFYFKSGIIDPFFNLLIFLALYQLTRVAYAAKPAGAAILGGILLGLAALSKGPVAFLVAGLTVVAFAIWQRSLRGLALRYLLLSFATALGTTATWFLAEIILHGPDLVVDFLVYQVRLFQTEDAGHGGPFFYHWIVLLVGCFPASAFLFQRRRPLTGEDARLRVLVRWMWVLLWVVLLLFSIVKTKIVHYSSLCYFPLTGIAAVFLWRTLESKASVRKGVVVVLAVLGLLLGLAITLMPVVGLHKEAIIPYIQDRFAQANLEAPVRWHYGEAAIGLLYVAGIITSLFLLKRQKLISGLLSLAVVQLVAIQSAMYVFVPKIEGYSQRAAIEYFESFQGQDVVVYPLGYKSYAHLFYTKKAQPLQLHPANDPYWFLSGKVDKPVFLISKITDASHWEEMPGMRRIGEKNGFVFFERIPDSALQSR